MTSDELHRLVNLVLLVSLMFAWSWSLVVHRRWFTRRQTAVSVALFPLFALIFKGTLTAFLAKDPTTTDTWVLSGSVGCLLAVMAAPSHIWHDRDKTKERHPRG